jgi:hypothetical protein
MLLSDLKTSKGILIGGGPGPKWQDDMPFLVPNW